MSTHPQSLETRLRYISTRTTTRIWKDRKIDEGLCAHCFQVPAGGFGGTWRLCAKCAKRNRKRAKALGLSRKVIKRYRLDAIPGKEAWNAVASMAVRRQKRKA